MIYLYAFLVILTALATLAPALPQAHGLFRSCEFPRVQIAFLSAVLMVAGPLFFTWSWWIWLLTALCGACLVIQFLIILRYSPIVRVQSRNAKRQSINQRTSVKFLVANVLQHNQRYDALCKQIVEQDADICIFMETDVAWARHLHSVSENYNQFIELPLDNTYGIMLWSKYPFKDSEIRFLVREDIPSIRATMTWPGTNSAFRLHVVHPEPPDPISRTVQRDAELVTVGLEVAEDDLPSIVTGDLNDVAWSRTTQRFQKLSGLLDPRIGRGLFSSFHAKYWFARWPLDHLFHSDDFSLVDMKRLPYTGSDHFPLIFQLVMEPETNSEIPPQNPSNGDRLEAEGLINLAVKS